MVMSDPYATIVVPTNRKEKMPTYTVNFEGYKIVQASDAEVAQDIVEEELMSITSDYWITEVEE